MSKTSHLPGRLIRRTWLLSTIACLVILTPDSALGARNKRPHIPWIEGPTVVTVGESFLVKVYATDDRELAAVEVDAFGKTTKQRTPRSWWAAVSVLLQATTPGLYTIKAVAIDQQGRRSGAKTITVQVLVRKENLRNKPPQSTANKPFTGKDR